MQEKADLALPSHPTQFRTQGNQMIVLDPNGVAASEEGVEALSKSAIDASIPAIRVMTKLNEIGEGMQKRPEGAVGEDGIKKIDLIGSKVHRANVNGAAARDGRFHGKAALRCGAAPPEPQATVLFKG